ncbi:hypothetical protein DICSQDRAFT_137572 [Dichomitus squalens LYAD-421 SS1]|uniref:Uncharacterized protein n=1 Tax=Dichomitus squalens (strain LYAD-421) TaxID=732165 RepID=R7SWY7_DICSQ|nr:uncharacterized protein DICSQDRAFT_137572 [Dichomitus squalens LYAD-421 SS1]EJF60483.1 hypothetical protein DICSQDRAFT_137572 [Dichomitus squalens LYAD-421 SS1]
MPPKTKTAKKRARSPEPAATKRASKRGKKDASATSSIVEDTTQTQTQDASNIDPSKAVKPADAPSFQGAFDLYAMELPFLNSVFTPARDYAALLEVIRTYQAKPDNSARIYLPADVSTAGRLQSGVIEDPLEDMPFELALSLLTLKNSLSFTACESSGAYFSEPTKASAGITGSVDLENDHCGVSSTSGSFKMRRAWVSSTGKDEIFEGFASVKIVYSGMYRRKSFENGCTVSFPFWAIRACVGEDGKEIGLQPLQ